MHHTFYISLPPRRLQQEIPSCHIYGGSNNDSKSADEIQANLFFHYHEYL